MSKLGAMGTQKYEVLRKKMRKKMKYFIAFFVAILVLMSTIPGSMATPPVSGKLWLDTIPDGAYFWEDEDAWLTESTVTTSSSFDLEIYYQHGDDIHFLYLLVAVNMTPSGNVTVNVNGSTVGPYDGIITGNNNALVEEVAGYEYPGHGIYKYGSSTHFEVVEVLNVTAGDDPLSADDTLIVPVNIIPINPVKVHFDAVGGDGSYEPIAFVPPSHDVTSDIPEFSTIAIPVAMILGLLFFFNHRKKRGE